MRIADAYLVYIIYFMANYHSLISSITGFRTFFLVSSRICSGDVHCFAFTGSLADISAGHGTVRPDDPDFPY